MKTLATLALMVGLANLACLWYLIDHLQPMIQLLDQLSGVE